jgi:hypothetical protein
MFSRNNLVLLPALLAAGFFAFSQTSLAEEATIQGLSDVDNDLDDADGDADGHASRKHKHRRAAHTATNESARSAEVVNAVRENGKKGGRPRGVKSKSTLIREEARRQLDQLITGKLGELFTLQYQIAQLGISAPSAANAAIENMLDRALGRPTPREETDAVSRVPVTIVNVFADGTAPSQPAKLPDVLVLPARRSE